MAGTVRIASEDEQAEAVSRLVSFAEKEKFCELHDAGFQLFWGPALAGGRREEMEELLALEMSRINWFSFFLFDLENKRGEVLAEIFLRREGLRLPRVQRRHIEELCQARLGIYEATEVKPGEGVRLKDLWIEGESWVRDRIASRMLKPWDVVVARLLQRPDGSAIFANTLYRYPVKDKAEILTRLEGLHKEFTRECGELSLQRFFRLAAPFFQHVWLEIRSRTTMPEVKTRDGHPVALVDLTWTILDADAVRAALDRCAALEAQEPGRWIWGEEDEKGVVHVLGWLKTEDRTLVLEAQCEAHAEEGRELVESCCGRHLRFEGKEVRDVGTMLDGSREGGAEGPSARPPKGLPGGVATTEDHVRMRFLFEYYLEWLHEPIPALDGRTPVQVAADPAARPRLAALLKEIENRGAHGGPEFDFTWLWRQLGFDPPGRLRHARPPAEMVVAMPHYVWEDGQAAPNRAVTRLRHFFGLIVAAASVVGEKGELVMTAVPCRHRPGRRPCPGRIAVRVEKDRIGWRCSACEAAGVIYDWLESPWDLAFRQERLEGLEEGETLRLLLDRRSYEQLLRCLRLGAVGHAALLAARPLERGVALVCQREEFRVLALTAVSEGKLDLAERLMKAHQ